MDLTAVFAQVNEIEANIEKEGGHIVILFKNKTQLGEKLSGVFVEKRDFRATGGKKFYELSVFDTGGARAQDLAVADSLTWNGRGYKITDKDAPTGDTLEWILELQPLGSSPAT